MKLKDVLSLMTKTKASYLATVNSEGFPEIRALLNLADTKAYPKLKDIAYEENEENGTITLYFSTNTSSRKTAQLRACPKASIYYCIPEKFLGACLTGTAEEITDQAVKTSFWQIGWTMYYHKGPTDPDYALFKFTSKSIHCWGGLKIHNFGDEPASEKVERFE